MRLITSLKDTEFPDNGYDHTRNIVRGIICDDNFNVAIVHVLTDDKFGHRDCYELPGGGKKKKETYHQGVLREVKEETGFEGKIVKFLAKVDDFYNLIHRNNHNYYYLVKANKFTGLDREEYENRVIQELLFVNIDEAIKLVSGVDDDGVGHLIKQRELPILKLAKEYIDEHPINK